MPSLVSLNSQLSIVQSWFKVLYNPVINSLLSFKAFSLILSWMDLSIHSLWVATQGLYFWLFNVPVTERHNIQLQYLKRASTVQMFTQLQEKIFISSGEALVDTKIKGLTKAMVCSVTIREFLASPCYEREMKDCLTVNFSSFLEGCMWLKGRQDEEFWDQSYKISKSVVIGTLPSGH